MARKRPITGRPPNDLDVLVVRKRAVDFVCHRSELGLQVSDEGSGIGRDAGLQGVGADVAVIFLPRHKLIAVVAVVVRAGQTEVARLQLVDHLREQAQLEVAAIDLAWRRLAALLPGDERPPFVRHERQIDEVDGDAFAASPFVAHHSEQ